MQQMRSKVLYYAYTSLIILLMYETKSGNITATSRYCYYYYLNPHMFNINSPFNLNVKAGIITIIIIIIVIINKILDKYGSYLQIKAMSCLVSFNKS